MSSNVRLQNLRDFTVQIRIAGTDTIVGTGIAVSMDGQVVTCAHVVEAALGVHPRQADGAEVGVYFPQAHGGEEKARRARVAACFPQHDDDVVLLQLMDGPAPLGPEQIAALGKAEPSAGNPFRSYGYRPLGEYEAGYAYGIILGCVECPEGFALQADLVQLQSQHIAPGMSGSAVLDTERNLVVGAISETWFPGPTLRPRHRLGRVQEARDAMQEALRRLLPGDRLEEYIKHLELLTDAPEPLEGLDKVMVPLREAAGWRGPDFEARRAAFIGAQEREG